MTILALGLFLLSVHLDGQWRATLDLCSCTRSRRRTSVGADIVDIATLTSGGNLQSTTVSLAERNRGQDISHHKNKTNGRDPIARWQKNT